MRARTTFIKAHGRIAIALLEYYNDLQDAIKALEDFYYGEWNSELDFATEFFHIDYRAFRRDLFINDFFSLEVESRVHVFAHH